MAELCQLTTKKLPSPIGLLTLEACKNGLHRIDREKPVGAFLSFEVDMDVKPQGGKQPEGPEKHLNLGTDWLISYFKNPGEIHKMKCPDFCLLPESTTDFERLVWRTLKDKVGFGHTVTYSELAELIDNPKASRAVGTALKKNPLLIIVPCHRVTRKDGKIGLYGGTEAGSQVKRFLIDHESKASNKEN